MKTFQYLNKDGKWIATQKKREEGTPLHVLHDSGSYRVFANADKLLHFPSLSLHAPKNLGDFQILPYRKSILLGFLVYQ